MQNFEVLAAVFPFLGHFFSHFFVIFSWTISVFCEARWFFRVKKDIFFHEKLRFLRGWMLFLVPFLAHFCHFFCLIRGERAKRASANSRHESRAWEAGRHLPRSSAPTSFSPVEPRREAPRLVVKKWSEWVSEWSEWVEWVKWVKVIFGSLKFLELLYVIGGVLT